MTQRTDAIEKALRELVESWADASEFLEHAKGCCSENDNCRHLHGPTEYCSCRLEKIEAEGNKIALNAEAALAMPKDCGGCHGTGEAVYGDIEKYTDDCEACHGKGTL